MQVPWGYEWNDELGKPGENLAGGCWMASVDSMVFRKKCVIFSSPIKLGGNEAFM